MALTTGLQAYWKLDESSGNAADSSGNGNTLTNTGSTTYVSALINNGASFDTTNKRLSSSTNVNFDWNGDYSWSLWVNVNSFSTTGYFLDHVTSIGASRRAIIYYDTSGKFRVFASGNEAFGASGFSSGAWHHIVVTKSSVNWLIYVDNVLQNSTTSNSISYTGDTVCIGAPYDTFGANANAKIDEIGTWNRALNTTEIAQLYNGGAGLSYPFGATSTSQPGFLSQYINQQ